MRCTALSLLLLFSTTLAAEPYCQGQVYREPACGKHCPQRECQDVSFNSDGSQFQCCKATKPAEKPPGANKPVPTPSKTK